MPTVIIIMEKRRKQIGYDNREPVVYEVFRERLTLD